MRPVDVSGWLVVVLVTVVDSTDGIMLGSRRYLMSLTAHIAGSGCLQLIWPVHQLNANELNQIPT